EAFYPDRMASRILGMGDVLTLVEKAQQAVSEEDTLGMLEKFQSGAFNFNDFLKIQKQLKRLGSMAGILNMLPIPGLTKDMKTMMGEASQSQQKTFQTLYNSMTKAERANPDLMNPTRIRRLSKGCGLSEKEVQAQITQFNQMRMMMQQLGKLFGGGALSDMMGHSAQKPPSPKAEGFALQMPRSQKPDKLSKPKLSAQEAMFQKMMQGKQPPKLPPGFPFQ
ncbi:MAG: hypothetical protein VKK59_07445, partial [Vampirovibrionales bacterium]|nr:hypothetical protein [Vampirovibrionales bacterium]